MTQGSRDLIAFGMGDHLAVPYRKELVSGFDAAVTAGQAAGAYDVTISGAPSGLLACASPGAAVGVATVMAEALTRVGKPARPLTPWFSESGLRLTDRDGVHLRRLAGSGWRGADTSAVVAGATIWSGWRCFDPGLWGQGR